MPTHPRRVPPGRPRPRPAGLPRRDRVEDLARRAAASSGPEQRDLRDQTVIAALPMARAVARRYGTGEALEDLHQVAALVQAVRRYRPGPGTTLAAYALPTVHGELKRHVRDHGWQIRPPRRLQELRLAARRITPGLTQRLHREPTPAEIARELGAHPEDVREAELAATGMTLRSLDEARTDGDDVGYDAGFDHLLTWQTVRELLAVRSAMERRAVALYFFDDVPQAVIGAEYGLSQVQVSRLIGAVLRGVRAALADGA